MSHERMTRSEVVERMELHRDLAEACITITEPRPGYPGPQHTYKVEMFAAANAYAALAIFYQGELRDTTDSEPSDKYKTALEEILEVRSRRLVTSPKPIESGPENWEVRTMMGIARKALEP